MKARSFYFALSGALGGGCGFAAMELVRRLLGTSDKAADWIASALQFAVFGLAVGAALGVTEGLAVRRSALWLRGLWIGGALGFVGGFVGGAVGEWIYDRVPVQSVMATRNDLMLVLDSSGSMKMMFFAGSDPWGRRRDAARRLAQRLSSDVRLGIVDFDETASVALPLTRLGDPGARDRALAAIRTIDSQGGTDLAAGLGTGLAELERHRVPDRPQAMIFLTDGVGDYDPRLADRARSAGVVIYSLGLGDEIDRQLLESLATTTGGRFIEVDDAGGLIEIFETIVVEHSNMLEGRAGSPRVDRRTSPILLWMARVLAWGAMGLLLGFGQGLRENSWQDLGACSRGGALGGLVGGALFDPLGLLVAGAGSAIAGRALGDVVVGALIGGSLRIAQEATEKRLAARGATKTAIVGGGLRIKKPRNYGSKIRRPLGRRRDGRSE